MRALIFLGGLALRPARAAHFAGHRGKTPALFARALFSDGHIGRQDVDLKGNAIDDADDGRNLRKRCR